MFDLYIPTLYHDEKLIIYRKMSARILTMDVINRVFAEARAKKAKRSYEEMAASELTGQHIISGQNQLISGQNQLTSGSGNAAVDKLARGIQEEKAKIERKVFEAEQPKKTRAKVKFFHFLKHSKKITQILKIVTQILKKITQILKKIKQNFTEKTFKFFADI